MKITKIVENEQGNPVEVVATLTEKESMFIVETGLNYILANGAASLLAQIQAHAEATEETPEQGELFPKMH